MYTVYADCLSGDQVSCAESHALGAGRIDVRQGDLPVGGRHHPVPQGQDAHRRVTQRQDLHCRLVCESDPHGADAQNERNGGDGDHRCGRYLHADLFCPLRPDLLQKDPHDPEHRGS